MAPVLLLYRCLLLSTPYTLALEEAQRLLQMANSTYSSNCWLCVDASNGGLGSPYPATPKEWTAIKACLAHTVTKFPKLISPGRLRLSTEVSNRFQASCGTNPIPLGSPLFSHSATLLGTHLHGDHKTPGNTSGNVTTQKMPPHPRCHRLSTHYLDSRVEGTISIL